jgi:hypothetical protein
MSLGILSSQPIPQTRRKVFVRYHHRGDQFYYDAFSRTFHEGYEALTDNSLERRIDSGDIDYIMRRIHGKVVGRARISRRL